VAFVEFGFWIVEFGVLDVEGKVRVPFTQRVLLLVDSLETDGEELVERFNSSLSRAVPFFGELHLASRRFTREMQLRISCVLLGWSGC
jgi:hypothetical protein